MKTDATTLAVSGMSCAACASRVERVLKSTPGVTKATVNLAMETASISWDAAQLTSVELATLITDAGYPAAPKTTETSDALSLQRNKETAGLRRDTLIAAALTAPVFLAEMGSHFIPGVAAAIDGSLGRTNSWILQFLLITLVLAWPGRRLFATGWPALARGAPDMNSLVALGTSAAWVFSSVALFLPSLLPEGTRSVYFEAAGVIITLILLGRWLEARAKTRTGAAIRALLALRPQEATIMRDGTWVDISVNKLRVGDLVRLRPGTRLATDGIVVSGESWVDESMISGEATPVAKRANDLVTGGTINGAGTLEFRATAVGENTVLANIRRMVEDAQADKLPIQAMVDKVVAVFVPVVLAIAVITILVWLIFGPEPALGLALVTGVSTLIVACPCAMGLATPTSIMVATGRAAELGVLFRKGDVLQSLSDADVIAFDKTGTLTEGRPSLTGFLVVDGIDPDDTLRKIASIEEMSEHPLAKAVTVAARSRGLQPMNVGQFNSLTGLGVSGRIGTELISIGNEALMAEQGIEIAALKTEAERSELNGITSVYAASDGELVALLSISDPIKGGTKAVISSLHAMGLRTAMITGDSKRTADAIASQLGIMSTSAGLLPEEKARTLSTLISGAEKLAFVGDGINDAPALAAADIGIAIGTGTDVAIETADIVLMSGALAGVAKATRISHATMRNIRQNLFWAFAYNVALIPVAAGVLYPVNGTLLSPMLAAGAMALSSLFVLSNALRLRGLAFGETL